MTRYLCAPDSFKESLTALAAATAMAEGIRRADRHAEIRLAPMADGGEGTARALADATGGTMVVAAAHDPLGRPIQAEFAMLGDGRTAVVETAAASGLALVGAAERDPLIASSFGTGELMRAALDAGAATIIVGLGGSATNDAGAGMLTALGVRFLDDAGRVLPAGGAALGSLAFIDADGLDPRLGGTEVIAACDVTNPLVGPNGASAVFGPQKGASGEDVAVLDRALARFAAVAGSQCGVDVAHLPGGGAAGGIGAALQAFAHARFRPGFELVSERIGLDEAVRWADVVFTGEGSVDAQTGFGKTPAGVAGMAKRHGRPVIAIAGHVGGGVEGLYGKGIDAIFGTAPGAASLDELLRDAAVNVAFTAEQVVRTMLLHR
ncbi:glycerate kinase [Bifidobacterium jacchi]|uniref:Glycerate kinase n=1 Tax=Bifidobacterium jacchi TaxID=2490545 RepID=A0A5N5RHZ1_9BIFI|nr:glycerate kinase [Bifidobacterium jacchi]KAB5606381.1 glycerate kinase [Bifidobacterium jacchi]